MAPAIVVGPIRPEWAMEPSRYIGPIWPPHAFLAGMSCPICGAPLTNGTPVAASERGLVHAGCGAEG